MTLKKLMNLKGRRALVTGAAGHLGTVICETLAEMGAELILVDLPGQKLRKLQKALKKNWGTKTWALTCNLESEVERTCLVGLVKMKIRGLNILINNASLVGANSLEGWNCPFRGQTLETWRRALEVNLTAGFDLIQKLEPLIRRSAGGNIINIASYYGVHGPDWRIYRGTKMGNPAAYAVSKGGLIQMTRWLATTLSPNIRVNAIAPGGIQKGQAKTFIRRYSSGTPLQRLGKVDEFRGSIALLASDLSSYMTGQILQVDGGRGTW